MHKVYLILGSNEGDRKKYIREAITNISNLPNSRIISESSVYQTEAWGRDNLPAHLNVVLEINTDLEPFELLNQLQYIELNLGRTRTDKWGIRTIDIDILYYDDMIINTDQLTIPHPLIQERKFVLVPLAELAPAMLHPKFQLSNADMLAQCIDELKVEKIQ